MIFPLNMADADIGHSEDHLVRWVVLIREHSPEILWQDRVFAMVLGAAKTSGYGRSHRGARRGDKS